MPPVIALFRRSPLVLDDSPAVSRLGRRRPGRVCPDSPEELTRVTVERVRARREESLGRHDDYRPERVAALLGRAVLHW